LRCRFRSRCTAIPFAGDLYVFRGKRGGLLKILWHDGLGMSLKFQIARLRRMQFGRSSERITREIEQLALQLEELETGEAQDIAKAECRCE
jgi:hypothetical protein